MVITVPRALTRIVRAHARTVAAGMALLVVFSVPVITAGEPALPVLPSYGVASTPHDGPAEPARDEGEYASADGHRVTVGPQPTTCEPRSGVRDMPDALPGRVLRLVVWDQPWWPADPPCVEPAPVQAAPETLPPTRAPPLTATPF
ncbi:hypothetical protein [Nocardiopsis lambiniae]|uniref:Secreted protein n=1 Tax=Nocardiopsis lambiniae TaxID=3075539 RepID=A0ABU2M8T7_9ACTN|nr:hypothetical protein [Nocardiopsis sp. DSM 44743]MDT0329034.1 hypothetical protein [Nocardiopsis sp. DSM 44743]